jgi:bifunctional DNA-binding transcriptional regulator/antitoxin component of YhaV-PrlF toxin-antitoxin module
MSVQKLRAMDEGTGLVIPQELLDALKLSAGDGVIVTRSPAGIEITPYTPERARQVAAGRELMRNYEDTFRELAR